MRCIFYAATLLFSYNIYKTLSALRECVFGLLASVQIYGERNRSIISHTSAMSDTVTLKLTCKAKIKWVLSETSNGSAAAKSNY
jgi:hypothetical protein